MCLDAGHAFLFRLVGEHGAFDHIADGVHAFGRGLKPLAHRNATASIELHSDRFEVQPVGHRHATGTEQDAVAFDRLIAVHRSRRGRVSCLLSAPVTRQPRWKFEALLFEDFERLGGHLAVGAGQDAVEVLQHGDLGTEPPPQRTEFQANDSAADDHQVLGRLIGTPVPRCWCQCVRHRARLRGSGATLLPVAMRMCGAVSCCSPSGIDGHFAWAAEAAAPEVAGDFVFLEQACDAFGERVSTTPDPCASSSLCEIERHLFATSMPCAAKLCLRLVVQFARLQARALLGMHPMRRQVPPSLGSFSMQATFMPSCAARMAATYPPGPAPMTIRSLYDFM